MYKVHTEIASQAYSDANRATGLVLAGLTSQTAIIAYTTFFTRYGWDVMEPMTYLLGAGGWVLCLGWFQINKLDFTYEAFHGHHQQQNYQKRAKRANFEPEKYHHVMTELYRLGETAPPWTNEDRKLLA